LHDQWKESIIIPTDEKGDKADCNNYCGISLLSISYKILSNIFLSLLSQYINEIIGDYPWEYSDTVFQLFVDFKKAYVSVKGEVLYNRLIEF
jgi:hypothetical protein